jgi:anti-sigma regulatory factor (Ser/Thr protein kinase)
VSAARVARRWVLEQIDVPATYRQDIALLVSELVTNAVLHARTKLVVGVTDLGDGVLVTVEDRDLVEPQQQPYSSTRTSGRGIQLMDTLADRWGIEKDESGKTVWCLVRVGGAR